MATKISSLIPYLPLPATTSATMPIPIKSPQDHAKAPSNRAFGLFCGGQNIRGGGRSKWMRQACGVEPPKTSLENIFTCFAPYFTTQYLLCGPVDRISPDAIHVQHATAQKSKMVAISDMDNAEASTATSSSITIRGPLAGLIALSHTRSNGWILTSPCDATYLNPAAVKWLTHLPNLYPNAACIIPTLNGATGEPPQECFAFACYRAESVLKHPTTKSLRHLVNLLQDKHYIAIPKTIAHAFNTQAAKITQSPILQRLESLIRAYEGELPSRNSALELYNDPINHAALKLTQRIRLLDTHLHDYDHAKLEWLESKKQTKLTFNVEKIASKESLFFQADEWQFLIQDKERYKRIRKCIGA